MADQKSTIYDVFLSHNSADKPAVEQLGKQLQKSGFKPFLDKWHLVPGTPWQTELEEALEASTCTAIFFGPSGEGAWHNQEMQVALNRAARTRDDYRVIPVLLPGADPAQIDGFLELRTWVDFRSGLDDQAANERLVAAIKGVAPASAEGLAELPDEPRPYRGIQRFDGEQHQFFFGRDDEIRRLIERLDQERFVAIVGASGSGKSSLARAGLFADAAEQAHPGIRDWHRIVMMPKSNPLLQLSANLVAHLPASERPRLIKSFMEDLRKSPDGLVTTLTTLFPNPGQPILLLVDQFEELFTQRPPASENQAAWRKQTASFAANLLALANEQLDWLRIVVTMRADFLGLFVGGDFPDFRTLLERRQLWLGAMGQDDLREVIVRPATQRGAFFEKRLVERILEDMHGEASALPLLEEALAALWDRRRGPWLTHEAYDEIGGVGGALADKADRIFESLKPADQAIARRVFLKLIQLGEGSRDTRRRVSLDSLRAVTDDSSDFQAVMERFSSAETRLITFSVDDDAAIAGQVNATTRTAEVTHEALIDHWDRLSDWLDKGRDDARLERQLESASQRWHDERQKPNGNPAGLLWRPPDLNIAREYVKRIEGSLTESQLEFYQRSERAEIWRKIKYFATVAILLVLAVGTPILIRNQTAKARDEATREATNKAERERQRETRQRGVVETAEKLADRLAAVNNTDNREQFTNALNNWLEELDELEGNPTLASVLNENRYTINLLKDLASDAKAGASFEALSDRLAMGKFDGRSFGSSLRNSLLKLDEDESGYRKLLQAKRETWFEEDRRCVERIVRAAKAHLNPQDVKVSREEFRSLYAGVLLLVEGPAVADAMREFEWQLSDWENSEQDERDSKTEGLEVAQKKLDKALNQELQDPIEPR